VTRRGDQGFTLPELLVAITILGIIMVAIGSMIVTSFRTTATVGDRLSASRGPKMVSRYWGPDVESAEEVATTGQCGTGSNIVATFAWRLNADVLSRQDAAPDDPPPPVRIVTWWEQAGTRERLIRASCTGGDVSDTIAVPDDTTVVVADLAGVPEKTEYDRRVTISVTVPDKSSKNDEFEFSVTGYRQVDP
jgi:prepilin-type N-terminal cleavage/methylation domain-containing protein